MPSVTSLSKGQLPGSISSHFDWISSRRLSLLARMRVDTWMPSAQPR